MEKETEFWRNILIAAETEPREVKAIRGASGHSHPVVALGVDENRKRVVMLSGEADARLASLAQGDIQAAMPSVKVVMARPIAINLSHIANFISSALGTVSIGQKEFDWMNQNKDEFEEKIKNASKQTSDLINQAIATPFGAMALNMVAVIKEAIQQLSLIEIEQKQAINDHKDETGNKAIPTFDISKLKLLDPAEADRIMGVCSIPLYDFTEQDIEELKSRQAPELAKKLLKEHDIYQYFFPSADQLTLGLVERSTSNVTELINQLTSTPLEGHPFGSLEIIDNKVQIDDLVPALKEMGLLVEGEVGIEVSPEGKKYRATVKFKPREGLISKLSKIFSVKIDFSLRDLFK